jgi:hypothetical protein
MSTTRPLRATTWDTKLPELRCANRTLLARLNRSHSVVGAFTGGRRGAAAVRSLGGPVTSPHAAGPFLRASWCEREPGGSTLRLSALSCGCDGVSVMPLRGSGTVRPCRAGAALAQRDREAALGLFPAAWRFPLGAVRGRAIVVASEGRPRTLSCRRGVTVRAWDTGSAAATLIFAEPWTFWMALANPAAIVTAKAFRRGCHRSGLTSAVSTRETKATCRAPKPRPVFGPS